MFLPFVLLILVILFASAYASSDVAKRENGFLSLTNEQVFGGLIGSILAFAWAAFVELMRLRRAAAGHRIAMSYANRTPY
jgi:hypothetical protein